MYMPLARMRSDISNHRRLKSLLSHYTLSEEQKNNTKYTVYTLKEQGGRNIHADIVETMESISSSLKKELRTLDSYETEKHAQCEKNIKLLDKVLARLKARKEMEEALNRLHDTLLHNKDDPSRLASNIKQAILGVENARKTLQAMKDKKSPEEIEETNKYINEVNSRFTKMLSLFFEKDLDKLVREDEPASTYWMIKGLYLEHFPKEATEYYSRLLDTEAQDKNAPQKTLALLDNILSCYPANNSPVNQNINYILANHFYRKFNTEYNDVTVQRACQHALQLNSNNPINAELKSIIINAAFYFEAADPKHGLPEEMETILAKSHDNPNAYTELCTSFNSTKPKETEAHPKPLQFSTPPGGLPLDMDPPIEESPRSLDVDHKKLTS
jgi:hypothetical protein